MSTQFDIKQMAQSLAEAEKNGVQIAPLTSTCPAMEFAYKTTGTDKVIIFDGAMGGLNCSQSMPSATVFPPIRSAPSPPGLMPPAWTSLKSPTATALPGPP